MSVALAFAACAAPAYARAQCSLTMPSSMPLGNYDPTEPITGITQTFQFSFVCGNSGSAAVTFELDAGVGANSTTFVGRSMSNGTDKLGYWLYPPGQSAGTSANVWGDGSAGSRTYTNSPPPNQTTVTATATIFIPANQDVGIGSYSDPVAFTMVFT